MKFANFCNFHNFCKVQKSIAKICKFCNVQSPPHTLTSTPIHPQNIQIDSLYFPCDQPVSHPSWEMTQITNKIAVSAPCFMFVFLDHHACSTSRHATENHRVRKLCSRYFVLAPEQQMNNYVSSRVHSMQIPCQRVKEMPRFSKFNAKQPSLSPLYAEHCFDYMLVYATKTTIMKLTLNIFM